MLRRWVWLSILAGLLAGCSPFRLGNPDARVLISGDLSQAVPLEPVPNWTVVPVAVNGRQGLRFLVDTGASATAIFLTDKTKGLNLQATSQFDLRGAGSGPPVKAGVARGVNLQVGALTLSNLDVVLIPAAAMPSLGDDKSFVLDGIIGYDLFSRYAVQVNYPASLLRLHPSAQVPRLPEDHVLPLEVKGGDVFAQLQAKPTGTSPLADIHVHLDTGASSALYVRADGSSVFALPEHAWASQGFGLQGASNVWVAPVAAVILGGITFEHELVDFQQKDFDPYLGRDGRLGHALLQRFDYTVDLPARQLILRTTPQTSRVPPAGFVGLGAVPYDGGYVVRKVTPQSAAAAAGFKDGDRLVRVAGHAVSELNWRQFDQLFKLEPGASIEICVGAAPVDCRRLTAVDGRQPPLVPASGSKEGARQ
jgi:hypothetical protein